MGGHDSHTGGPNRDLVNTMVAMSIRCGHCHQRHDTVDDVRACAGDPKPRSTRRRTRMPDPAGIDTADGPYSTSGYTGPGPQRPNDADIHKRIGSTQSYDDA